MRDLETIELAITAAETGHLVFGTLHASSAPKTIDRLIDGDLTLRDLDSDVHLTANDIKKVLSRAKPIGIGEIK